ncbi:phosphatidylethanolamine-binding protein F40A3.3-like protein [Aphelenchoides avenae]|nr:phosphatidylethanolamine-binding protein F40A3.3-like protein [Aphelenchus avenae]
MNILQQTSPFAELEKELTLTTTHNDLWELFAAHLVVPDVVDRPPLYRLPVKYAHSSDIEIGTTLEMAEEFGNPPRVDMKSMDEDKHYTLIMTDPDVPNRTQPTDREFLHWMVINISRNNVDKGDEIVPYVPPLPQRGSGLHRYVFLLLEQSTPLPADRLAWKHSSSPTKLENGSPKFSNNKEAALQCAAKPPTPVFTPKHSPVPSPKRTTQSPLPASPLTKTPPVGPAAQWPERTGFSTKEFMAKYLIKCVAAGSFFQAEHNGAVDELLDKLTSKELTDNLQDCQEQDLSEPIVLKPRRVKTAAPRMKFTEPGNAQSLARAITAKKQQGPVPIVTQDSKQLANATIRKKPVGKDASNAKSDGQHKALVAMDNGKENGLPSTMQNLKISKKEVPVIEKNSVKKNRI